MEIDGVNPVTTEMPQYTAAPEPEPTDEETPPSAPTEGVETEAVEQEEEGGGPKGVLRLLMEGHFKGVADVRLRINFCEELQALQNQQMTGAAGEKIDEVVAAVDGVFANSPPAEAPQEGAGEVLELEEGSPDMEQIQQAFADSVNEAKEEFVNSDEPSQSGLVGGLQSAFDSLVQSIRDFFAPPADTGTEEPPDEAEPEMLLEDVETTGGERIIAPPDGEEVAPVELAGEGEPVEEPVFDVEAFIEELNAAFDAALAALTETLNGVSVLPPLSEPSGKGRAYEKFLNIYNDLYGVEPAGEELNAVEPVETTEPGQLAET